MLPQDKQGWEIMNVNSSIYTDMSLSRDSVALSPAKQNTDQALQLNITANKEVPRSSPVNESRGTLLDILV